MTMHHHRAVAQQTEEIQRWIYDQQVQILLGTNLHDNLGQVVHTYVPLSLSSITWYQSKGDALRLGESNGSLPSGG